MPAPTRGPEGGAPRHGTLRRHAARRGRARSSLRDAPALARDGHRRPKWPWLLFVASLVLLWSDADSAGRRDPRRRRLRHARGPRRVPRSGSARSYWRWLSQDYLITNRRVVKVEGIINKRSADSSLEKINDAVLEPEPHRADLQLRRPRHPDRRRCRDRPVPDAQPGAGVQARDAQPEARSRGRVQPADARRRRSAPRAGVPDRSPAAPAAAPVDPPAAAR